MTTGSQRPGVKHFSFTEPGATRFYGRDYSHHELAQTRPGARRCGICDRWIVRGMGRWWARG
jgi:hypothetical protein